MDVTSIIQKPKTLTRTLSSALISWENIFPDVDENKNVNTDANTKYILQMENFLYEWKTIYWGSKRQYLVRGMAPCSYHNFRLKFYNEQEESDWIHFKSGTDAIPFFVMHFTRAVKFGKMPVIRKIISRRPVLLETENKEGKTPLIQAVEGGNLQMVTFLLNIGANVNTATLITMRTPLMVALFNNNIQISSLLIDKGANLSARDCNSLTGLHHAVDSDILENVELCLDHEFDVNAEDNQGWTPLLRAVILNCSDEMIQLLLNRGADSKIKDKKGFNFHKHLGLVKRANLEQFIVTNENVIEKANNSKEESINKEETKPNIVSNKVTNEKLKENEQEQLNERQ